jgi:hypothetical protein
MRLSLSVNGAAPMVASLPGSGYLSAHLNMSNCPKDSDFSKHVRVVGIETREKETAYLKWPTLDLNTGDVVQVKILPDGEGDTPSEIRRSSEAPSNLFTDINLAKEVLLAVSDFEQRFEQLSEKSEKIEPAYEHKKFRAAWATVAVQLGQSLLYPIYRRHKELIPEEFKGERL